jgi:hypothetical protein
MNNQENNTTDWLFEITQKIILFAEPQESLAIPWFADAFRERDVVTVHKQF